MFRFASPKRTANKIILLVLTLELLAMSLWAVLTYLSSQEELLNTISSKLNESAVRTATVVDKFFDPIESEIKAIAKISRIKKMDESEQQLLLQLLLNERPEIEEISTINSEGSEQVRISRMLGISVSDLRNVNELELVRRARFDQQQGSPKKVVSEISFSSYLEPQINILYPLQGNTNSILLTINLKWLWDTVEDQPIGRSGYIYLLDKHLTLIAHRDPSLVLKSASVVDSGVPSDLFSDAGQQALKVYKNLNGQQVAGVSYFDRENNWWIVVEQPVAEGLAPLDRVVKRFVIAFILVAVSTFFIVVYFSRRTMRPLEKLAQGITRLKMGDRNVQIEVSGDSDLSSLARGFNDMALSIDQNLEKILQTQQVILASRKSLEVSEGQVRMLLDSTKEAIYGVDLNGICTFSNQAALKYLGLSSIDEIVGIKVVELFTVKPKNEKSNSDIANRIHNPSKLGKGIYSDSLLICIAGSETLHVELRSRPVFEDLKLVGAVITFTDISERFSFQQALKYQANHDSLTGLSNRKVLHERLNDVLNATPPNNRFSLLFIDLDRFKEINDSLGHNSGDELLKLIGPRLQSLLNSEDLLVRLGGDEFAIMMRSITTVEHINTFAQSIKNALKMPFALADMQIQIDASIGIAICPQQANDGSTLMRYADVAMYHAKSQGSGYAIYEPDLDAHSPRRLALSGELRNAINENQLRLHYQPKIRLEDQRIVGYEALVRWQHPQYGLLMPDQFIPLAELGELINPLTLWVVNQALSDRLKWHTQGWDFDIAVNVSVRNLQDTDFVNKIQKKLNLEGTLTPHLDMEITESSIMSDTVKAQQTLHQLYELGIRFAIDDYGTGYSSLAYLKKLSVDFLKIDKSFIMNVTENDSDAMIVRSTIELAHNMGLKVIAEGVENQDSLNYLRDLRCDLVQGYFISRPMPEADVIAWSKNWSATKGKNAGSMG